MSGHHLALQRLLLVPQFRMTRRERRPSDMHSWFESDDLLVRFDSSNEILLNVVHVSLTEELLNRWIKFRFSAASGSLRRNEGRGERKSAFWEKRKRRGRRRMDWWCSGRDGGMGRWRNGRRLTVPLLLLLLAWPGTGPFIPRASSASASSMYWSQFWVSTSLPLRFVPDRIDFTRRLQRKQRKWGKVVSSSPLPSFDRSLPRSRPSPRLQ